MRKLTERLCSAALVMCMLSGSVTALATDVNMTSDVVIDDDDERVTYSEINIKEVTNQLNYVMVRSDIATGGGYGILLYCSENGGEYKPLSKDMKNITYELDNTFDGCGEVYVKGLTNGQKYSFKFALVYHGEEVAYSEPVTFYRLKRAVMDRDVSGYLRNGRTTVKWSRNSKADGYLIQCYKQGSKETTKKNFWVRNNKTRSKVLTGLSSKYDTVSIKAYKKVNGKYYYSYAYTRIIYG